MNPIARRSSKRDRAPKASRQMPKRTKASCRHEADRVVLPLVSPGLDLESGKRNPQAEADKLRDERLLKDLQDNANRSDLAKHRREISATNEDHEDADAEDAEGLPQLGQMPEPAADGATDD